MDGHVSIKKLLILAANPKGTSPLGLGEEVREIESGLQRAQKGGLFAIDQKWAVRPRDIRRAMLDINPQIVHFSGHGAGKEGLVFEGETGQAKLIDGETLAELFEMFAQKLECVVLNGCYSEVQAEAISHHIPYVIGMKKAIGDRAAIEFAVGFYDALGAGRPVEFAYRLGCNAIRMEGIAEHLTPVLISNKNINKADELPFMVSSEAAVLTPGERCRLETERNELQEQFDSLSEEIQFLQQCERTDDLTPKARFRLKKQIEQSKQERQQMSDKIKILENKLQ